MRAQTTNLIHNPYVRDILDQPRAVRNGLDSLEISALEPLAWSLHKGGFDRIILTGMGASFYGLYPAWLILAAAGYPAIWVDAAELAHVAQPLITPKTMVMVASQSGRSAEVVSVLNQISTKTLHGRLPGALVAITNDINSPLAEAAHQMQHLRSENGLVLRLNAEPEQTPSTRTYLLTLAVTQLAAKLLSQYAQPDYNGLRRQFDDLGRALDEIERYLQDWELRMGEIGVLVAGSDERSHIPPVALLGRGASMGAVMAGALSLQEAGRIPALGLQAAQFRHGPLEMAAPGLSALVFGGPAGVARELNRKLTGELRDKGVETGWLASGEGGPDCLGMPSADGIGLPLAEIIPVQLLCVFLALRAGFSPGEFRHIGKVTEVE